jgi:hypothetical protein
MLMCGSRRWGLANWAGRGFRASALLGAAGTLLSERRAAHCQEKHQQMGGRVLPTSGTLLASATAGVSVLAAAAPALCAVHCAAMPVIAVALPSLQHIGGGVCMHSFARKLAIYFVVPLGLVANVVGYNNHGSIAITSSSLLGVSCVTAAATVKQVAPHRNIFNGVGCLLMLGASYRGRQLEQELGCGCCSSGCDADGD